MKPTVPLPPELQQEYDAIEKEFSNIKDDRNKNNNEIIAEDPLFARKILAFLIEVIKYIELNPSKIKVNEWLEFLSQYYYPFSYAPGGDERNYLDFDEVSIPEILSDIEYDDALEISKAQLKTLKKLFIEARKKFIVPCHNP